MPYVSTDEKTKKKLSSKRGSKKVEDDKTTSEATDILRIQPGTSTEPPQTQESVDPSDIQTPEVSSLSLSEAADNSTRALKSLN